MKRPDIFDLHANVCRTLANPTRLKILALLGKQEMSVGRMAATIGASLSNVSQHLAVLKAQQLVVARRHAQSVSYRLADRRIIRACALTRAVLLDRMRERGEVAEATDPRYVVTDVE